MVALSDHGGAPKNVIEGPAKDAILGYLADMGVQLAALAKDAGVPAVAVLFESAGQAALQAGEKAATEDAA
jgi:hypothetical protein